MVFSKLNMNPIVNLLENERFNDEEYQYIAQILNRENDITTLKRIHIDTVKECILHKLNNGNFSKFITLTSVSLLPELDCKEFCNINKASNTNFNCSFIDDSSKTALAFHLLNASQRVVLKDIVMKLSCTLDLNGKLTDPTIILLDAPSGTGKSHLIDCLSVIVKSKFKIAIVAKSHALLNSITEIRSPNISTYTTCKFIMEQFSLEYREAIGLFNDKYDTFSGLENLIDSLVQSSTSLPFDLIILDEYSMESPVFIVVLALIAKKHNVNLLFMGDIKQQNTLSTSRYHQGRNTNYTLLNTLEKNVTNYSLSTQMRIVDDKLLGLVNTINSLINYTGNQSNTFEIKLYIFQIFRDAFFRVGNILKCTYLTDTHMKIKKRFNSLMGYVNANKLEHKVSMFKYKDAGTGAVKELELPKDGKYLPYLLLIKNARYYYNDKFVTIESIKDDYITARYDNTNTVVEIRPCIWTSTEHSCVDANYHWLTSFLPYNTNVLQYPIRHPFFTYYFVQGMTFKNQGVVIDLDTKLINSLYVGFSRVLTGSQICEIETDDVLNLLFTEYKNDEFIYKVNNNKGLRSDLLGYWKDPKYQFNDTRKYRTLSNVAFQNNCRKGTFKATKRKLEAEEEHSTKKRQKVETSELSKYLVKKYE